MDSMSTDTMDPIETGIDSQLMLELLCLMHEHRMRSVFYSRPHPVCLRLSREGPGCAIFCSEASIARALFSESSRLGKKR